MKSKYKTVLQSSLMLLGCGLFFAGCKGVDSSSSSQGVSSSASSSAVSLVLAINAGTSTAVNFEGIEYGADRFATGGGYSKTLNLINDSAAFELYQTARSGSFRYQIPVSNAHYRVELHFAEIGQIAPNKRIFGVEVEGREIFSDLDLYAQVGGYSPWRSSEDNIAVDDGYLTIAFEAKVGKPILNGFAIYSSDGGKLMPPSIPALTDLGQPQLGGLARGETKYLGNVLGSNIPEDYAQFWNQATLESVGSWMAIEAYRDTMNWSVADLFYSYARDNDLMMHHFFLSGSLQPAWVSSVGEVLLHAEIEDWMSAYCERYPDPKIIEVVREPINNPPAYRKFLGGEGETGWDWVVWSYEKARQYCPEAHLIIDEYSILDNITQIENYKKLIAILMERNLIDGIGIRAHNRTLKNLTASELKESLDLLAQLNLPIHITGMDIGYADPLEQQARYAELFPVFWEHPVVVGVTLWGYKYGEIFATENSDLMEGETPKPAFIWLMEYFEQRRSQANNELPFRISVF